MSVLGVWLRRTISIHVPLAGHDVNDFIPTICLFCISIHVPLAGHDVAADAQGERRGKISIHVPLAGHDH